MSDYFYNYNGLYFDRTCLCSPEQYDVYDVIGNQIGYIRIRWGEAHFCKPDFSEAFHHEIISDYDLTGRGEFSSDEESKKFLRKCARIYNKRQSSNE